MAENNRLLQHRVEGRNLILERMFDAPREQVFLAYSDSNQLASWWGPQGWETENQKFEFKPDGVWQYCMRCTDKNQGDFYGQESRGKGVFQEIKAPEKIVYTDAFADEHGNPVEGMPETVITMEFVEQDGRTKLISNTQFTSEKELKSILDMGVVEGVSSQFECLDEHLKKEK
ncbi:Uncharacterized conserved protein YndB, AHSA1/START domain [Thalassobacillus cyri]|uniref:Uncharacterized conserved protein YndB, AHSA1/START domain n=1 Tax=Thalassobacillus cyri TaxID=571932 RepID=A0A1H4FPR1_9BACI|nr:SRPBCC domain-containing protein [Thalassobacillus cyri]SEA98482.1 Uncharacterized conserved protein YndB, AHSA1/START domain [Thalassobacillus cyri]